MENQPNIEQEIAQLEKQLSEKKRLRQLADLGQTENQENELSEKEILHSVVGEKIQQQIPNYQPAPLTNNPRQSQSDDVSSYSDPELKGKVQNLINTVFNKSLDEGIKEASRLNNPALIDAFHDVLVDELYNTLLERKKLEALK